MSIKFNIRFRDIFCCCSLRRGRKRWLVCEVGGGVGALNSGQKRDEKEVIFVIGNLIVVQVSL